MDQAIYAKAQEIRWQTSLDMNTQLILRLGEFHTAMVFLVVIGKRFRDAGLHDIAIESGIVAEGSMNTVLNCHQYNRSLQCHKIIAEAMHRLQLHDYLEQLPESGLDAAFGLIATIRDSFPGRFMECINQESVRQFIEGYQTYILEKCNDNVTYAFWTSYLEMVELLQLFIRATKEGKWQRVDNDHYIQMSTERRD